MLTPSYLYPFPEQGPLSLVVNLLKLEMDNATKNATMKALVMMVVTVINQNFHVNR